MKKLDYAIVFVSDMKRSVTFYRDVLGMPLKYETPHWTEFSNDGSILALHPGDAINPMPASEGTAPAGSCHLGFVVEDLDAFHKHMQANKVACLHPPKKEEFGRLALYADPDGLPFSVAEPPKGKKW